jgi:4'-phosphopantetheinyl transferase
MLKGYYGNIQLVKDPAVFDKWLKKMDPKRRDKVLACRNEADRQRSLLAGILLHFALERDRNCDDCKKVFYSISHAGDYAICVISDRIVGVDIEHRYRGVFDNETQLDNVAKKCLAMGESIRFQTADNEEKMSLFLKYWTRKESYSKSIQKGLAIDFSTIDTEKMDKKYWSDWLEEGYYCSLYVKNGVFADMELKKILTL